MLKEQEMTTIHLSDGIIKDEILVVGLSHKKGKSSLTIESGDIALDSKKILPLLADMNATGKADEVIKIAGTTTRLLVFTGLGEHKANYEDETLRRAAGAAARALAGSSSATISLPTKKSSAVGAIAEGALLGAYVFNKFRVDSLSDRRPSLKTVTVHSSLAQDSKAKAFVKRASIIGEQTAIVRDLINTPPSHLTPDSFCKFFTDLVKKVGGASSGLKVSVMTDAQLKSKGYGGITAVGQGSANPPRLLRRL
jgi:leucyl aminopeptidase